MPPELTGVLAALAVEGSPGEFAAVESLLGGSFSGLGEIRRNPVARLDAAGLAGREVRDWLCGLPLGQDSEVQVAWIADRLGARMGFAAFASNVSDLWFPAMDDVVCVVRSAGSLAVLVLDHEELITLSSVNPPAAEGGQPRPRRWREMLSQFPAMRQVFHALCALGEGEDATEMLAFAARQEWMTDLARRAGSVARLDDTVPAEPQTDDLLKTLWELYAASRVRDVLLLAHQPGPADDSVRDLDEALGRQQPRFPPVPAGQITQFFAAVGCQPVTEAGFDPILHEIISCEAAEEPDAPIQITRHAWPALMIGELVFARAGVHVRAGSAHAVPGIADRSTLQWEYWRRHRTTCDGSFWWGHNSQWRTQLRRDYITSRGHVYDFDAFSSFSRQGRLPAADDSAQAPLTADQASFIKNRCQPRTDEEPSFDYLDRGIDERHH